MAFSKYGFRYGSRPESFTDVVVEMRSTVFSGVAADELLSVAELDAELLAEALDELPDDPEHAASASANTTANAAAKTALNLMLPFIVPLSLGPVKQCDPLHRFVTFHTT